MKSIREITISSFFAALIFVTTAYVMHFPITGGGYVHIGDSIIYLASCMLPTSWAITASAIGAGLSDAIFAPFYIIPTVIIKSALTLFFTNKTQKILCKRNVIAVFLAGITGVLGYYLVDTFAVFNGDFVKSFPTLLFGLIQPAASGIAFVIIAYALDKIKIKNRISI